MMCVTGFRAGEHLAAWADRNAEFGAEITRELEQRGLRCEIQSDKWS